MNCPNKRSIANHNRVGKYHWSKQAKNSITAENNHNWKGDIVGYFSLHEWIRKRKPKPCLCEECNKQPPFDLANISGEYKRDVTDFKWLCRGCHMKSDGRLLNNLRQNQERRHSFQEGTLQ